MKPKRGVSFDIEGEQTKTRLNQLCESMGKLRVQKSIHKFPLFSILKPTIEPNQMNQLADSLADIKIAKRPESRKYRYYNSPFARLKDVPRSANAYYSSQEQKILKKAKDSLDHLQPKEEPVTPFISVGQPLFISRNAPQ